MSLGDQTAVNQNSYVERKARLPGFLEGDQVPSIGRVTAPGSVTRKGDGIEVARRRSRKFGVRTTDRGDIVHVEGPSAGGG